MYLEQDIKFLQEVCTRLEVWQVFAENISQKRCRWKGATDHIHSEWFESGGNCQER